MEKKINTNTSTLLKKKITLDLGTYKIIKVNSYQGDAGEYNLIDLETVPLQKMITNITLILTLEDHL
jgi:hypothetical protein